MVREVPRIDLHTMLKSCYFADKRHLNEHDRPIFGAIYRAMRFGPVPLEIYEMAKGEVLWLPEIDRDKYPWRLEGFRLSLEENQAPDLDALSETDFAFLKEALELSSHMTFDARTAATHGPDWQAAQLGRMRYEDMIDEDKRGRLIPYLLENAQYMRL
jgi:uncharacterized phage-associated protein